MSEDTDTRVRIAVTFQNKQGGHLSSYMTLSRWKAVKFILFHGLLS